MAFLRDAIKVLDPSSDKQKELTLALSLLSELCEIKVNEFENNIFKSFRTAGTGENYTVPIYKQIGTYKDYRAYVKDDVSKIGDEISKVLNKFISGSTPEIISGIGDLLTSALTTVLGEGEASQREMHQYCVVIQDYSIVRYDISIWKRNIQATGITSKIQDCLAIYCSKASVNVQSLDLNTFISIYADQLNNLNIPKTEIKKYLDESEAIYLKLKGNTPSKIIKNISIETSNKYTAKRAGEIIII